MYKSIPILLLVALAAGCGGRPQVGANVSTMDPGRKVSQQDCSRPLENDGGNLLCREITEAERRARIAAEERAERERLERERAEQLAREEAARQLQAAEEARLAAERRRLEAEAERKAQEARERQEKLEAEARERLRAEQAAREEAARECRRLEQERLDGRAVLAKFVADYGKVDEFIGIAGQISAFLAKARKVKPCPPA